MTPTTRVSVVFAVCGTQRMLVYGEDLLRHIVADGESQQLLTMEIPIGRPESAQVLEEAFATYPELTVDVVRRIAAQVPTMERVMDQDPRLGP